MKYLGPDFHKSLNEAIIALYDKGILSEENKAILRDLSFTNDQQL